MMMGAWSRMGIHIVVNGREPAVSTVYLLVAYYYPLYSYIAAVDWYNVPLGLVPHEDGLMMLTPVSLDLPEDVAI